ncbi:MAG: TIGR02147 family protein [Bdellovibrio sp.]|nr:TIGR02147 family protein [Bdellovibrio sp.]
MKQKPQVMYYVDYHRFLQDWYDHHKEHARGFSFGTWATQCGFKSRSFLQQVAAKKRNLSPESLPQILKSLELTEEEAQYFELLVRYSDATTIQTKEYFFQKILKLNKKQFNNHVRDVYGFLSNPKTPRVHLLLSLEPLQCTADYIAHTCNIPLPEVQDILANIANCGLAKFDTETQCWSTTHLDLKIPTEISNDAIQAFHYHSLMEAQNAITLPPKERHLETLLMTLKDEEYQDLKQDIDQFLNFLSAKYSSKDLGGARIFQMNLNVIPTSTNLIAESST